MGNENFMSGSLSKVLDALKSNIMRNTHVATFAQVKEILNNNRVMVEFLPRTKETKTYVNVYNASPFEVKVDDVVIVIFTDKNFKINLRQYESGYELTEIEANVLHSIEFGVIISVYGGTIATKDTYPIEWSSSYSNDVLTQTLTMNDGTTLSNEITIHAGTSGVTSVNGKTGDVVLTISDIGDVPEVAITGDYNDLINRPTVYSNVVEGDMLSGVFDKITPQLQTLEPDSTRFQYWYKEEVEENETQNLLLSTSDDIININNNNTLLDDSNNLLDDYGTQEQSEILSD